MANKFNHLHVPDQWNNYFTRYPQGMTILESLMNWISDVDKLVDSVNDFQDFVDSYDENMREKVRNTLSDWHETGFLGEVINEALHTKIDEGLNSVNEKLAQTNNDLIDRGVNLKTLGAVLDGVADDYEIVMNALNVYKHVVVPPDAIIGTSNTIFVEKGQSLVGLADNIRGYGSTPTIKYIGEENRKKAVVVIGSNDVGAEPTVDGTDIIFKNFLISANNKAGFGIYGSYLTNETKVKNVVTKNSLEYGGYFIKGWYASITDITSLMNKGKGLAFGMPLIYQSGEEVVFETISPLEMNNVEINNIRSHRDGLHYTNDNPNTFDPTDPEMNIHGYGIGFGIGNSFTATKFLSERSGGVPLYVYTNAQPIKTIEHGYIEGANEGADLLESERCGVIIENTHTSGGPIELRDIFINYSNGGGIYFKGGNDSRKVWLRNIHEPRFLKSLNGIKELDLYSVVLKDNVSAYCGISNTLVRLGHLNTEETINTMDYWTIEFKKSIHPQLIQVKGDGTQPSGRIRFRTADGSEHYQNFPPNLGTEFTNLRIGSYVSAQYVEVGEVDSLVTFRVIDMPRTYL